MEDASVVAVTVAGCPESDLPARISVLLENLGTALALLDEAAGLCLRD
jgi:hypothetical protein|tara:strand:+ start:2938 stop:3081 length:144 start_codon:yes stop_codon:yes gene_type:complete